jgi:hypothetical protein
MIPEMQMDYTSSRRERKPFRGQTITGNVRVAARFFGKP